jgi:hypothetical protein
MCHDTGAKFDKGLEDLLAKKQAGKLSDSKFETERLQLGRDCWGSRGSTPLTSLLKSPLHLLLDGLHMRNSMLKICFLILCETCQNNGVLNLVKAAASKRVQALFSLFTAGSISNSSADTYDIDGNSFCAFVEGSPEMLEPLRGTCFDVFIMLWDFMRCAAIVCKTVSTMHREGYQARLDAFVPIVERWVQLLFHMAPRYYLRPYVPLIRYLWPLQAKSMWQLHQIPLAWASLQAAESRNGKMRCNLAQSGGVVNQSMKDSETGCTSKFGQALRHTALDTLVGARALDVTHKLGLQPISKYVVPCVHL